MIAKSLSLIAIAGLVAAVTDNAGADTAAAGVRETVVARMLLSNPSEFPRPDEITLISLSKLGLEADEVRHLSVLDGEETLPAQLADFDGDGAKDSLVFTAGFGPAESRTVHIVNTDTAAPAFRQRAQAEISIKEGGGWEDRKYVGGQFRNVRAVTPPSQYTDHSEYIRYEARVSSPISLATGFTSTGATALIFLERRSRKWCCRTWARTATIPTTRWPTGAWTC